jgi:hypothetical protein
MQISLVSLYSIKTIPASRQSFPKFSEINSRTFPHLPQIDEYPEELEVSESYTVPIESSNFTQSHLKLLRIEREMVSVVLVVENLKCNLGGAA